MQTKKTMKDLNDEIEIYQELLACSISEDNNDEFIENMNQFREFLKSASTLLSGYLQLYGQFKEQEIYNTYKDYFMFCEAFHERLIEISEKENIIKNKKILPSIERNLSLEYNKRFYQDITNELNALDKYMKESKNFLMVGCGSFPITLFSICEKYKKLRSTGIDSSLEAIINAKELKMKLSFDNLCLEIVDGINYNYNMMDTIFIANLVIPKTKVLKRIAMTSKSKTKILLRVPVLYGSLLSEDVNYTSMNSFKLVENIEPSKKTDDILYKLLVLEKI